MGQDEKSTAGGRTAVPVTCQSWERNILATYKEPFKFVGQTRKINSLLDMYT